MSQKLSWDHHHWSLPVSTCALSSKVTMCFIFHYIKTSRSVSFQNSHLKETDVKLEQLWNERLKWCLEHSVFQLNHSLFMEHLVEQKKKKEKKFKKITFFEWDINKTAESYGVSGIGKSTGSLFLPSLQDRQWDLSALKHGQGGLGNRGSSL